MLIPVLCPCSYVFLTHQDIEEPSTAAAPVIVLTPAGSEFAVPVSLAAQPDVDEVTFLSGFFCELWSEVLKAWSS